MKRFFCADETNSKLGVKVGSVWTRVPTGWNICAGKMKGGIGGNPVPTCTVLISVGWVPMPAITEAAALLADAADDSG